MFEFLSVASGNISSKLELHVLQSDEAYYRRIRRLSSPMQKPVDEPSSQLNSVFKYEIRQRTRLSASFSHVA